MLSPGEDGGGSQSLLASHSSKKTRSTQACLACRSKKVRCEGHPPSQCVACVRERRKCYWSCTDGRSSEARSWKRTKPSPEQSSDAPWGRREDHNTQFSWDSSSQAPAGTTSVTSMSTDKSQVYPHEAFTSDVETINTAFLSQGVQDGSAFDLDWRDSIDHVWDFTAPLRSIKTNPSSCISWNLHDEEGISSLLAPGPSTQRSAAENVQPVLRISWWRPHGQTAIAPGETIILNIVRLSPIAVVSLPQVDDAVRSSPSGLQRITLKVKIDDTLGTTASPASGPLFRITGAEPSPPGLNLDESSDPVVAHLLDLFFQHFGCQFPYLNRVTLDAKIRSRTVSMFLLNAIAALVSRFSKDPAIALPGIEPYAYGETFYKRCKSLLGSMLGVPSRDTVAACLMLSHVAFAHDSESEVWEMTGIAVRMSLDLGLHLQVQPEDSLSRDEEDLRLDRVLFWSVILMDYALSFGVGRCTANRYEEVTQRLPVQSDILADEATVRSPFPYAARMMFNYGRIIDGLNRPKVDQARLAEDMVYIFREYTRLPLDMQWNIPNLQTQVQAGNSAIFLHLHLWFHTILASSYLTSMSSQDTSSFNTDIPVSELNHQKVSPASILRSNVWLHSARKIGDIMLLSDVFCPLAYCALPFVNQAFFVAGCCHLKEMDRMDPHSAYDSNSSQSELPEATRFASNSDGDDLFSDVPRSHAQRNVSNMLNGLNNQLRYWSGIAWIASALQQRIEGAAIVDLAGVTANLPSFISHPEIGLARDPQTSLQNGQSTTQLGGWTSSDDFTRAGFDMWINLPFDFLDMEQGSR